MCATQFFSTEARGSIGFLPSAKVMFSQACVKNSVYRGCMHGRGACMVGVGCAWQGGACMAGEGNAWQWGHAWQGAYMADSVHRGWGHVWQVGMHGWQGGMCSRGHVVGGGMCGRGHAWRVGCAWQGVGMCGGVGMHGRGHVWRGGRAWQGGMCSRGHVVGGGMCGRGHAWRVGCAWQGVGMCGGVGMHGRGHVWRGGRAWQERRPLQRTVRIPKPVRPKPYHTDAKWRIAEYTVNQQMIPYSESQSTKTFIEEQ